jgi:hypothetical protein
MGMIEPLRYSHEAASFALKGSVVSSAIKVLGDSAPSYDLNHKRQYFVWVVGTTPTAVRLPSENVDGLGGAWDPAAPGWCCKIIATASVKRPISIQK